MGIGAKPGLLRLGGGGDRTGLQQVTEALNGAQLDSARPGSGQAVTLLQQHRVYFSGLFLMMDLTYVFFS